jgi:non-specific protein-tyrosine kinase
VDLRQQLSVIRSWSKWIVAATVLAALAAFALTNILPKTYESEAELLVGQTLQTTNPNVDVVQTSQSLARTYAEVATTRRVLAAVMARVGASGSVNDFAEKITVTTSRDQPIIVITARDGDPQDAADIANAMADELKSQAPAISGAEAGPRSFAEEDLANTEEQITAVRTEIAALGKIRDPTEVQQSRLDELQGRLVTLQGIYVAMLSSVDSTSANTLSIIDPAVAEPAPASPRPIFDTALAAVLALLVAVGAVFLWEKLDDRLKSPEDVERVTGLPVLGTIVRMPGDGDRKPFYRLATLLFPRSPAAEAFRTLRTNVEFASVDEPFRTLVVTSSVPGEGKTVVAANLAIAFAQAGRRTILVDADLRRPGVHDIFSVANSAGLTDMVRDQDIDLADVARRTEEPELTIVTAGAIPANPAELLGSHRTELVLQRIRDAADLVVIDTAPVATVTDAAVLAARADATIFVVQPYQTSQRNVIRGREALAKVGAVVAGVVLNNVPAGRVESHPYYVSSPTEGAVEGGPMPGSGVPVMVPVVSAAAAGNQPAPTAEPSRNGGEAAPAPHQTVRSTRSRRRRSSSQASGGQLGGVDSES